MKQKERENTIQYVLKLSQSTWSRSLLDYEAGRFLQSISYLYDLYQKIGGTFKVTIEFYPEGEQDA